VTAEILDIWYTVYLLKRYKIENYFIQFVPIERLDRITTSNHQGVIAYLSPMEYANFEELVGG
jgi:tRNA G18 (ribose-2'-O)-methylase SpoU